jgi:hypothetical protein
LILIYDFLYFTGNRTHLNDDEIDNLILIFNQDLEEKDMKKVSKIVNKLVDTIAYSLKKDGKLIEMKSKIDLANIWK